MQQAEQLHIAKLERESSQGRNYKNVLSTCLASWRNISSFVAPKVLKRLL